MSTELKVCYLTSVQAPFKIVRLTKVVQEENYNIYVFSIFDALNRRYHLSLFLSLEMAGYVSCVRSISLKKLSIRLPD